MGLSLGVVLPMSEFAPDGVAPRWPEMLATTRLAEEIGADTIWLGDEILWRDPESSAPLMGWWDMPAVAGALAAGTSSIRIGSWVMSAAQHQPGMIVRAAEALDEISGEGSSSASGPVTEAEPPSSGSLPTRPSRAISKRWRSSCRCCAGRSR